MWDIRYYYEGTFWGDLIKCVPCNSVWVSFIAAYFIGEYIFLNWLAISAIAMFLEVVYDMLSVKAFPAYSVDQSGGLRLHDDQVGRTGSPESKGQDQQQDL
jgi:mannose/fructose/N-acetylgalactosamine-specific phosphotransferase system component IIC